MLPSFIYPKDAPFGVLPPGMHYASLAEIEERFCTNDHRRNLFNGLCRLIDALKIAGCTAFYLDGSFVSDKPLPSDFDGCWDPKGVVALRLDPVLLDFENGRAAQKAAYGGEVFPATWPATQGADVRFLEFFQQDKHTGSKKGLVAIRLDDTI